MRDKIRILYLKKQNTHKNFKNKTYHVIATKRSSESSQKKKYICHIH